MGGVGSLAAKNPNIENNFIGALSYKKYKNIQSYELFIAEGLQCFVYKLWFLCTDIWFVIFQPVYISLSVLYWGGGLGEFLDIPVLEKLGC